jgi:hypothetical protein
MFILNGHQGVYQQMTVIQWAVEAIQAQGGQVKN